MPMLVLVLVLVLDLRAPKVTNEQPTVTVAAADDDDDEPTSVQGKGWQCSDEERVQIRRTATPHERDHQRER